MRRDSVSLNEGSGLFVPASMLIIAQRRIYSCRGMAIIMQQRFRRTDRLSWKRKIGWSTKRGAHEARHFEEIRERERERAVDQ